MKKINKAVLAATLAIILMLTACTQKTGSSSSSPNSQASVSLSSSEPSSSVSSEPSSAAASSAAEPLIIDGFVQLKDLDSDFVFDLKYATTDNFTHQKVYPNDVCALRVATAQKLVNANKELKEQGYRIKVWDAYRPFSVQKIFWSIEPDERFVADPNNGGSRHNKGCAVDITMVDSSGKDVEMPSGFDDFTEKANRNSKSMTPAARANMDLLTNVMTSCGFTTISDEWWHFDDSDAASYSIADVDLSRFIK